MHWPKDYMIKNFFVKITFTHCIYSIGCGHDGDTGCPDGASVMSRYLPSGGAAFHLSNCTKQCATKFLK